MRAFEASRETARQQWAVFAPRAGADYAAQRNIDAGPDRPATVSQLSPHLRLRLILESEVALAAHQMHGDAAEKFVQEVCWRTYWKGWLERRPQIWHDYQAELQHRAPQRRLPDYQRAINGETGIACFDAWAAELRDNGYLHNHARMWAASIWIFTLRLPWTLGADWFLTQLLDGDAASNTLSWRWVAGLHTPGKHYLARADNIARFTQGRFHPRGQLVEDAAPLGVPQHPAPGPVPTSSNVDATSATGWLVHADDLDGDGQLTRQLTQILGRAPEATTVMRSADERQLSHKVQAFRGAARQDAQRYLSAASAVDAESVLAWAQAAGLRQIVMPYLPVGAAQDALRPLIDQWQASGLQVAMLVRDWDLSLWPHAGKGFFQLRQKIPDLIAGLSATETGSL